jgi:hypothetical protein
MADMTSVPVPLAEQTTDLQFVERHLHRCENEWKKVYPPHEQDDIDREIASFRRVLATLQQHERAMAVVDAARQLQALRYGEAEKDALDIALAALDAAENTAGDAVTTEEDKDLGKGRR